jgi:hypothetical protein
MTEASRSTAWSSPEAPSQGEANPPLAAAVRELFSGLRAGAADVADLVAAEAHLALRLLIAMTVSAIGAMVLGVFGLAGLAAAAVAELIAQGISTSMAIAVIALLCIVGSVLFILQLRGLSRRVLFGYSREHLRGKLRELP